jgi:pyruvate/2-oxoglutarate dehydrogenase complex dihydrolipoamide dehydrogenase (E3) component
MKEIEELRRAIDSTESSKPAFPGASLGKLPQRISTAPRRPVSDVVVDLCSREDGQPIMEKHFDAIVIGTGQSGPFLAVRMAAAGKRVAIIERHRFGGTCVNTGCIPTKTLVASAYNAHMVRRAADFGVQVDGKPRVDMKRVKARKDEITGKSRTGLESWLKNTPNCTVYRGHARFESPKEVTVGEELLSAEDFH